MQSYKLFVEALSTTSGKMEEEGEPLQYKVKGQVIMIHCLDICKHQKNKSKVQYRPSAAR